MDPNFKNLAPATSEELAGDIAPLAQALGGPEALASFRALAELVGMPWPESTAAMRSFLARYRERLLTPLELPVIRDAYRHAERGEVRELIELDRGLAARLGDSAFADASRLTGRLQLRRLRPVRNSTLQRYLQAVDTEDATGWHVVVFGLLMALFSLPLRQGLVHYATKTQHSLVDSASARLAVTPTQRLVLLQECDAPVSAAVQAVLPHFEPAVA